MRQYMKVVSVLLIVVFLVTITGCYGSFPLVKKLYTWNGTLGNKFVNEAAFLGLCILPVYEIAGAVDVLILNTIEFWTGKNPVQASVDLPERNATVTSNVDDGSLTLTSADGRVMTVRRIADGAEVRTEDGELLARSFRGPDGVTIYGADGAMLGMMTNDQIASLATPGQ